MKHELGIELKFTQDANWVLDKVIVIAEDNRGEIGGGAAKSRIEVVFSCDTLSHAGEFLYDLEDFCERENIEVHLTVNPDFDKNPGASA